jgi:hypothetical protein
MHYMLLWKVPEHAFFFQLLIISVLGSGCLFSLAQGILFFLFAVGY